MFIATNKDATIPNPKGYLECGAGVCVAAVEYAVGRPADLVIGKPSPTMYEEALKYYGVSSHEVLFVGDRIDTDILGAKRIGAKTCLVLSGVTPEDKYQEIFTKNNIKSDLVMQDLATLANEIDLHFAK